jgi:regulator of nucleoside diphosphate kinase
MKIHWPVVRVTDRNHRKLSSVLASPIGQRMPAASDALAAELERALVVASEQIDPCVVTMNSRVRYENVATRRVSEIALVYPWDADPANEQVSVLSPVGTALLGLSMGDLIDWPIPGRPRVRLRLVRVLYQPEAARDSVA